jgi:hypothetical protein
MRILSLFIFLLSVFPLTIAEAADKTHTLKSEKIEKSRHYGHPASKKHSRSSKHHSYFRGKNHFFLYVDGYRVSPYVRYKQPRQKHVVIEKDVQPTKVIKKTVTKTRYVPVEKRPTATLCGGETVYLRDRTTGELIIRYISPATKC